MFNADKMTKICSCCGKEKPLGEFHRRRHGVNCGHRAACKACTRIENQRAQCRRSLSKLDQKKQQIRARTRTAIQKNWLTPLPCQVCGCTEVQPHHLDYEAKDAHLKVQWLCKKHHGFEHGKRPWTKQLELFPAPI